MTLSKPQQESQSSILMVVSPTGTGPTTVSPSHLSEGYQLYKRLFDLVVCLFALPLLLLMMAVIGIIIAVDSPGSPFFIQERVGKDGRRFRMIKFRTMHCDHDDQADRAFMQAYIRGERGGELGERDALNKPIEKGEITRVGRFLRKASLDELPQIINVIKGEMSLVGPRPNVPWEVEFYSDWHYERLKVLPGVTGLAQVHGRSSISFEEIAQYDIQYVRNASLSLDMTIILRTVGSVLTTNGAG